MGRGPVRGAVPHRPTGGRGHAVDEFRLLWRRRGTLTTTPWPRALLRAQLEEWRAARDAQREHVSNLDINLLLLDLDRLTDD